MINKNRNTEGFSIRPKPTPTPRLGFLEKAAVVATTFMGASATAAEFANFSEDACMEIGATAAAAATYVFFRHDIENTIQKLKKFVPNTLFPLSMAFATGYYCANELSGFSVEASGLVGFAASACVYVAQQVEREKDI